MFNSCFLSILRFSQEIRLSAAEKEDVREISDLAISIIVLWNDYCSWEKEHEEYLSRQLSGRIANRIYVFMNIHSTDAVSAKKLLRAELINREERYYNPSDDFIARKPPSGEVMRSFALFELAIAGNALWSLTTAR